MSDTDHSEYESIVDFCDGALAEICAAIDSDAGILFCFHSGHTITSLQISTGVDAAFALREMAAAIRRFAGEIESGAVATAIEQQQHLAGCLLPELERD